MRWAMTILATAVCLMGCGKAPDKSSSAGSADKTMIAARDKADPLVELRRLAPGARSAVLFRAINAAQQTCSKVTGSGYQQDYQKMAMFVARCPEAGPYAVFVSPNGYAQVRACAVLGPNVPPCRAKAISPSP